MTYRFHPEALEEYQEAARYYAKRDPALGSRFIEAVEDAIQRILEAPERWRVLDDDVRRCLTHVFPYGILHTIEPEFNLYCRHDAWQPPARLLAAASRHALTTGLRPVLATLMRLNRSDNLYARDVPSWILSEWQREARIV